MEQFLGDYKVLKHSETGPFGNILIAEHRFIKKNYILKLLPSELAEDPEFCARFEEEVAQLAQLDHPHIAKIHTVSRVEAHYFLVMEAEEESDLASYMEGRGERLKEEELLALMHQIAAALEYAHLKGHVHQCLTLSSLSLKKAQSEAEIHVSISDFGMAKIISPGKLISRCVQEAAGALGVLPKEQQLYSSVPFGREALSTLSAAFLQKFAFLAPEQKKCEQAGIEADSYAFGVLAYFLIAGRFPEGIFPMPSEIAPEYRYDWDHLISLCLQQDPKRRPSQLIPLLEKKKIEGESPPAQAEAPFVPEPIVEPFKPVNLRPQPFEKEEPTLKPVIQRSIEKTVSLHTPAQLVTVAAVEVKEKIAENSEESYSNQLNALLNRDPIVTQYQPERKESGTIDPLQTEMEIIRGGYFYRGSNSGSRDEMPRHRIALESFALDIHPVTNEQFVLFLDFTGGEKDSNYNDLIRLKDSRLSRSAGKLTIEPGYAKHPVVGVTWYGAMAYAKWAGKRLPTEVEWEIAAYGGHENHIYPTGDVIEKGQANFFSSDTTAVMHYAPNGYGLYDMAGNVYEWCQDWYGYSYYETSLQEPTNPKGPPQGVYRVLRGGCWKSLQDDLRCSHRHRNNPGTVNSTYGFRCAADVE